MKEYYFDRALTDPEYGSQFYEDYGYRDNILYNKFDTTPGRPPEDSDKLGFALYLNNSPDEIRIDAKHKYNMNSMGYRSPEFTGTDDLVIAGCSYALGMGVPEDLSWGVQVAKELGVPYANISIAGISSYYTIKNVFAYIKKYGNPKMILMMLPELNRFYMPSNQFLLKSKNVSKADLIPTNHRLSHVSLNDYAIADYISISDKASYSKSPHYIEEVITPEVVYFYTVELLHALEMYCSAAGIKLVWSMWHESNENSLLKAKTDNPSFFENMISLKVDHDEDCFKDFKASHEYCFDIGSDDEAGRPHPGLHDHSHWAKLYLDKLSESN